MKYVNWVIPFNLLNILFFSALIFSNNCIFSKYYDVSEMTIWTHDNKRMTKTKEKEAYSLNDQEQRIIVMKNQNYWAT